MSRRDTIIIAVLVNAGLLMILFATAMRSDKESPAEAEPLAKVPVIKEAPASATPKAEPTNTYAALNEPQEEIYFGEDLNLSLPTEEPEVVSAPAPKPTLAPKKEDSFVNVTVKKGDVLEKIARANNTSVAAIMKANNMSTTTLKVGQVLRVPLKEGTKAPPTPTPAQGEYYVVKDGDSPWLIASKNNIRLDDLLRLNNLDDQKAKRIRPGDKLRIR